MQTLLGLTLAAGGLSLAVPPAAATGTGITVYTWTDANGVTHFSDTPHHPDAARQLTLPAPPPPDQTAAKAEKAWLSKLHRLTQADQARAARRRAEQEHERAIAEQQQQQQVSEPRLYQYVPIFYPARHRRHRHRSHRGQYGRQLPSARFPHYALPSSFPDPLASSFPPGLPGSFPEAPSSPPRRP